MDIETGSKGGREQGGRQEDGMGWDVNADSAPFPLPPSLPPFPSSSLSPLPFVGTKWVMALMVGE